MCPHNFVTKIKSWYELADKESYFFFKPVILHLFKYTKAFFRNAELLIVQKGYFIWFENSPFRESIPNIVYICLGT